MNSVSWRRSWSTWAVITACLGLGCAFSNTNPFTGSTQWTIGDACNDCAYDANGYPTKGQASGPLSEQTAKALEEALKKEREECAGSEEERCRRLLEDAEAGGEELADGVVDLPEEESERILDLVDGEEGPGLPPK